jgi:hypothetical protein
MRTENITQIRKKYKHGRQKEQSSTSIPGTREPLSRSV